MKESPVVQPEVNALPTAVIDKSVFQRICEHSSSDRRRMFAELNKRFYLVIPFVLIEEVLVNRGQPGLIARRVIETMFRELMRLRGHWVDDELGWIFQELVKKIETSEFKLVSAEFLHRVARVRPSSPAYQDFLNERKSLIEDALEERVRLQNEAADWMMSQARPNELWFSDEHGRVCCLLANEKLFFEKFILPGFNARGQKPELWFEMMNHSLGYRMRTRFPEATAAIDQALHNLSNNTIFESRVTFVTIIAKLFYFWAPLVRIGKDKRDARNIIGRSKNAQTGNAHDERYIAMALLCDTLITRDRDMAKIAEAFCRCGLWKGRPLHLPPGDIRQQIGKLSLK